MRDINSRIGLYLVVIVLLVAMLTACDEVSIASPRTVQEFEVQTALPAPEATMGNRASINNAPAETGITHVYVKVFDTSGNHLPANNESQVSELTYSSSKWTGTVSLKNTVSGNIRFQLWAINSSNQHLYSGTTNFTVGTNNNSVTLTTQSGYDVGDRGPGGGLIIYAATDYTSGWRYIEAAPSDFSYTWSGILVDNDLEVNTSPGDVVVKVGKGYTFDGVSYSQGETVMSTYQWYWGSPDFLTAPTGTLAGNFGTTKPVGDGLANNQLLRHDDVSGVTPKIAKMPGRREQLNNTQRRDIAKTLGGGNLVDNTVSPAVVKHTYTAASINNYSDWFVPSKDELHAMYALKGVSDLNLSGKYWSSTESAHTGDNPSKTISNTAGYEAIDINSWMEDFSLAEVSSQYQELRSTLARVRPVRRF